MIELLKKEIEKVYVGRNALDNDTFDRTGKVHDWRNYVPEIIRENWSQLTEQEKLLVILTAEPSAANEEWE